MYDKLTNLLSFGVAKHSKSQRHREQLFTVPILTDMNTIIIPVKDRSPPTPGIK